MGGNLVKISKILLSALAFSLSLCTTQIVAQEVSELAADTYESSGRFKAYGEYLYWKVVQDEMQYAAVLPGGIQQIIQDINNNQTNNGLNIQEKLSIIDPSFKYKSGFRVGIGYKLPCSNWDFDLAWVRLHEKISSSVSNVDQGVIPLTMPASAIFGFINRDPSEFNFCSEAISKWDFKFDTIDLEIGRTCILTGCVKMRPFIGVKAACIKQSQNIDYLGFTVNNLPINIHNQKKNHFRGIGPSLGVDSSWEFYENLNLTGSVSGAFLCGKFDVSNHPSAMQDPSAISFDLSLSKKHRIRPMMDARIGLDWSTSFCDKFDILLGVSYEAQYWWNQWQAAPSVVGNIITGGVSPKGDLMMYGLTANAMILF